MLSRIIFYCCFTTFVSGGFTEISGTLTCNDCLECGPVKGEIELWERDEFSADDFQDKKPIVNGKYEGIKFNEFEWLPTEPYFLIKHSCSPSFWINNHTRLPDKLNCHVKTKYAFEEPSSRLEIINLELRKEGKSEIVCE